MRFVVAALVLAGLGLAGVANAVRADVPPTETGELGSVRVIIYTWDFLSAEELAALRLVMVNKDALALFVPADGKAGFAALAVSPDEGFIRDGLLVPSASAIAGLETQEAASVAAYDACNTLRKGKTDCTIVLEVAPK